MLRQEYEDWDEEKQYTWADSQMAPGFAYVYIWYAALHANLWKHEEINTFIFFEDVSNSLSARSGILNAAFSVIWKGVTGNVGFILHEKEYPIISVGTEMIKDENRIREARKTIDSELANSIYKKGVLENDQEINNFFVNAKGSICKITFPDKMVLILQKPADDGLLLYAIDGSGQKELVPRGVLYDTLGRLQSLGDQALNTLPDLINCGWQPIGVPLDLD